MSGKSLPKKIKREVEESLRISQRILRYRRDVIDPAAMARQIKAGETLQELMARTAQPSLQDVETALSNLQKILKQNGGAMYPRTFWNENVDMVLVAAIVVLTIRTFFIQPFIIPTNSMFPSYNGMTFSHYEQSEGGPVAPLRVVRRLVLGASHYSVSAPRSGEVLIPVFQPVNRDGRIQFNYVQGRKWFGLLPALLREYRFVVDGVEQTLRVPQEFNLDDLILEAFFPDSPNLESALSRANRENLLVRQQGALYVRTGNHVSAGDAILRFDLLSGDALFVDRFSYHFFRPKLGDPFVFRTRYIEGLRQMDGQLQDKYYIKRIAGVPGDSLEIREPVLFRNGRPETGRRAFRDNASQQGAFRGYRALGQLSPGQTVDLGPNQFYALGDNSGNSLDSRVFGPVPQSEIIGRAFFIYYPFSHRWGLAR